MKTQERPGGSRNKGVLISGGMGGLGLALAQWWASQGVGTLYLLGRRPLPFTA